MAPGPLPAPWRPIVTHRSGCDGAGRLGWLLCLGVGHLHIRWEDGGNFVDDRQAGDAPLVTEGAGLTFEM